MKVDGQDVRLVGVSQQLHIDDKYFTKVYVVGCIHSKRAYLCLDDTGCAALDGQPAYMSDARHVDPTGASNAFEYELTLRWLVPRIEEMDCNR